MIISKLVIYFLALHVAHPFHVSVCEIDYNQDENTLQISHRIFMDDLESALNNFTREKIYMQQTDHKYIREVLVDYLQEKFRVVLGSSLMDLSLIGYEIERDVVWVYQEAQDVDISSTLIVTNSILLDIFNDQQNLVHFSYQGNTKSLRLNKRIPSDKFNFE